MRDTPALSAIILSAVCRRGNRSTCLLDQFQSFFSDVQGRADAVHRQIPQVSIPFEHRQPPRVYFCWQLFPYLEEKPEGSCCKNNLPFRVPLACRVSWSSILCSAWVAGTTGFQLAQLSVSVAVLFLALIVPLHVLHFVFFPVLLFTTFTSCLPSQEPVIATLFYFSSFQTVISSCHSPPKEPAVPSSPSFRH